MICITLNNWTWGQNKIEVENKQKDTISVDILEYEYIVLFNDYFCSTCHVKDYSQSRILMIYYNKHSLDKIERIKLCKSMKKIYKNADIYFTTLPLKNIKTNIITPSKEFIIN